jgi:hypothetical protein
MCSDFRPVALWALVRNDDNVERVTRIELAYQLGRQTGKALQSGFITRKGKTVRE